MTLLQKILFAFCCLSLNFGLIFGNIQLNNACAHKISYITRLTNFECHYNPNVRSQIGNMILRGGYQSEDHGFISSDGVIMHLFRIKTNKGLGNQPVFIQHGINADAAAYVNHGNRSIAFVLADAGYDVWLGNIRGTVYSREHVTLSPDNKKFWNFNLDTLAAVDVRESLKYVAKTTGKAGEIIYIGHSMGTILSYFYAASYPDEAKSLLKGIVSLSPVGYINGTRALFFDTLPYFSEIIRSGLQVFGLRGLFTNSDLVLKASTTICGFLPFTCSAFNRFLYGNPDGQLLAEEELLYFGSWPNAAAVDVYVQFLQIAKKKKLSYFDFGSVENKKIYGQNEPPLYDLGKITVPVGLFFGENDALVPVQNVMRLYNEIGSKKQLIQIGDDKVKFNHLAFIYGKDVRVFLYGKLFKMIKNELSSQSSDGEKHLHLPVLRA